MFDNLSITKISFENFLKFYALKLFLYYFMSKVFKIITNFIRICDSKFDFKIFLLLYRL